VVVQSLHDGATMKALAYKRPGRVEVTNKPDPRIEHPDDVVLRVVRSAICGSDLHLFAGLVPDTRVGTTFGHEFAGVVEEVGPGVTTLRRGDRVVVPFNIACGTCFFCQRALTSLCDRSNPANDILGGVFGYSHTTGGYDGGQAELVRVPFADVGPMKVPEDMDFDDVLFLSDILPTGYQAAEMGSIKEGDTVAVFGSGPVGLFTAKSAWLMGAGRVILIDRLDYRLEFARNYTKAEIVDYEDAGKHDVVGRLRAMTDGRGPDVCIDAVGCEASGSLMHKLTGQAKLQAGAPTSIFWAVQSVRRGGHVVVIGVYGPPWNLIPMGELMNKGLTLRSAQCNVKRYLPRLLEHIRAGRIDAKAIVTHTAPLDAAPELYQLFRSKRDGCIKCVLVPNAA
jgi:threonine dehydrogenase-like Zn-dependent dehydrogenase